MVIEEFKAWFKEQNLRDKDGAKEWLPLLLTVFNVGVEAQRKKDVKLTLKFDGHLPVSIAAAIQRGHINENK